ncbi:hypothetical protein [uncultured Kiloniella sp.]|uniref:hypothetical protein n=1 Tax=uncultured Kiloniella sp. TaxID=1133091 RepID=UPI00261BF91B|nr:hypothetical protein [uncultured Kiloniella sp.]
MFFENAISSKKHILSGKVNQYMSLYKYITILITLINFPTLAYSEERKLSGEEIRQYLTDKKVVHRQDANNGFWQTFNASGITHYQAQGRKAEQGKWNVQADQYCSQWRPFGWTCYDMTVQGNLITWISKEGTLYKGRIIDQ